MWFGKVNQIEDEVIIGEGESDIVDTIDEDDPDNNLFSIDLDDDNDSNNIDPILEEKQKQILQAKDQTKIQRRQRSGEILPFQSWRRQSTFRKQSITQMMQLSKQSSSQQLLQPLTLGTKDKQLQESPQRKPDNPIFRKGSVIRRPTLRADSTENAKLCVTNDLEDFIEVIIILDIILDFIY